MKDFKFFLEEKCRIPGKKVPFFLYWVAKYQKYCKGLTQRDAESVDSFLEALSVNHPEWQVKQADKAISLYFYYTNSRSAPTTSTGVRPQPKAPLDWKSVKEEVVRLLRLKHRSYRTEKTYLGWINRFSIYLSGKNCQDVTQKDLTDYLSYLAVEKTVSASTQKQAFNALLFVFRYVFCTEIKGLEGTIRSGIQRRLPVVLSRKEVSRIFSHLKGTHRLMAGIIFGGGLRLQECLMLRIKDVDIERNCITVRSGKGDKDRQTLFPGNLKKNFERHIKKIREIYDDDRKKSIDGVWLPEALERKYPQAGEGWSWFWVFPSHKLSVDPTSKKVRRHHIYPSTLQKAFRKAVRDSGISKRATIHSMRHTFATCLIENGYEIRTVQELLGHSSVQTTMIYTHVAKKNKLGVRSPMEEIDL